MGDRDVARLLDAAKHWREVVEVTSDAGIVVKDADTYSSFLGVCKLLALHIPFPDELTLLLVGVQNREVGATSTKKRAMSRSSTHPVSETELADRNQRLKRGRVVGRVCRTETG